MGPAASTSVTGASSTATLNGTFTAVAGSGTYTAEQSLHCAEYGGREWRDRHVLRPHCQRQFRQCRSLSDLQRRIMFEVELTAGNVWTGGTAANDWNTGRQLDRRRSADAEQHAPRPASPLSQHRRADSPSAISGPTTVGHHAVLQHAPAYTFGIDGNGNSLTLNGIGVVDNSNHAPTFTVGSGGGAELHERRHRRRRHHQYKQRRHDFVRRQEHRRQRAIQYRERRRR